MRKKKSKSFCQVDHLELRRLLSTIYVDPTAPGTNNGTSWTNAFTDLQSGLTAANSGDTVEVAYGTYTPTSGTDRTATFQLKSGVNVYGDDGGYRVSVLHERILKGESILSGDIGTVGNPEDNSYHVVTASNVVPGSKASLDDFKITSGYAYAPPEGSHPANANEGGGILISGGSPIITDCTITGNVAKTYGGAVYAGGTNATFNSCTITGNRAGEGGGGTGGGIMIGGSSNVSLSNCTISSNISEEGGGGVAISHASATLNGCTLTLNGAGGGGGAISVESGSISLTDSILSGNTAYWGGGFYDEGSTAALTNCVISGNSAVSIGGAINDVSATDNIVNCTIAGNNSGTGSALFNSGATTTITNSIFWADTGPAPTEIAGTVTASYSDIEGGYSGTGNINIDPAFVGDPGAIGSGNYGDLRLQASSPARDVGSNAAISGTSLDYAGYSRVSNGVVDLGAYEFQVIFVDAYATGANDGSSWANAFTSLQSGLALAPSNSIINVAAGTYYPTTGTDRTGTFYLKNGVSIYGGFEGGTQANPNQRDFTNFASVLSGNIGATQDSSDNSYNVVNGNGTNSTAVLDGFTISGGNADGSSDQSGGGILDSGGSPTLNDCTITGNTAENKGGGIYSYNSSSELTGCVISNNTAASGAGMADRGPGTITLNDSTLSGNTTNGDGGAAYNWDGVEMVLDDCVISGNTAGTGGAFYNFGSPMHLYASFISNNTAADIGGGGVLYGSHDDDAIISDCIITNNRALDGNGGALKWISSTVTLTDSMLSSNSAGENGGAIEAYVTNFKLNSCTLSGNTATVAGGAVLDYASTLTATNTIFWGDSAPTDSEISTQAGSAPTLTYSDIDQSGFTGAGDINSNPMFVRPPSTIAPSDAGDLHLHNGSPAIDTGSNAAVGTTTIGLDESPRIINGIVDMGAYEARPILYVDASATGTNDGTSWANAYTTLTAALEDVIAGAGQTVDVAQGTYYPTNSGDRNASFTLVKDTDVYGGFAGDSQANPGERNVSLYPTILSGDIGVTGAHTYQVVDISNTYAAATLDGFTITGGEAFNGHKGGGIYGYKGYADVNDCTITGNTTDYRGGGIYLNAGTPTISNCTISYNYAASAGGGIAFNGLTVVTGSTVVDNSTLGDGGGIWGKFFFNISNTRILANKAMAGGGVYCAQVFDSFLTDCLLVGNSAATGGAIQNEFGLGLRDCTVTGNTATSGGGAVYDRGDGYLIVNSILWNNSAPSGPEIVIVPGSNAPITSTDIDQTGYAGTNNNIDSNPGFLRSPGAGTDGLWGTADDDFGDLQINSTSPVVNAGDNTKVDSSTSGDFLGNPRIIGGTVDMGAYEALLAHLVFDTKPAGNITAGDSLPIKVDVLDGNGNVIAGNNSNVTLQIASGPAGAALHGTLTTAAQGGAATFSGVNITQPGTYTLSASDGSLPGATTASFNIIPAAASQLVISQQPGDTTAGQDIPAVRVKVEDPFGNLVDGTSVSVALPAGGSIGTLNGATPVATTGGTADFTGLSINQAGTFSLAISDSSLPLITSNSFVIAPGAPASMVISQQPASAIAGQNIPVSIEVEDQFGNPTDGSSVTVAIASGPAGAHLAGTLNLPTTGGTAAFNNLTLDRAGVYTLSATDGALPALTTSSFNITYAGNQLVFTTEPPSAIAGAKLSSITVSPESTAGAPITTDKSTVTLTLTSGGKLIGSAKGKVKNGSVTFNKLSIQKAGTYTLTATDSAFASAVSSSFTISSGAPKKLSFAAQPANIAVNTPFNVSVNLLDRYGNAVDHGSTVTLVLGSHPKTASGLDLSAIVGDGSAEFDNVILSAAGNYTLKASDGKAKATSKKFVVS